MRTTRLVVAKEKTLRSYQQSQILGLDPVQLIIKVYDFVILNCKKGDMTKASKGLVELISALNFDCQEISLGLFRLYQYCMEKIKNKEFDEAVHILEGLRNAWTQSLPKNEKKE